jgi:hypothetical protein
MPQPTEWAMKRGPEVLRTRVVKVMPLPEEVVALCYGRGCHGGVW